MQYLISDFDLSTAPFVGTASNDIRNVRRSPSSNLGTSSRGPVVSSVLLPAPKAAYIPNLRPSPKLRTRSTPIPQRQDPRSQKVIISKHLLEDGTITFALGAKAGGTLIHDSDEISLDRILDHVTPFELERFETAEFIKEDEQEEDAIRLTAIRKPKGRPVGWRADMGLTYAKFVEMNGGVTQYNETKTKNGPVEPPKFSKQTMLPQRRRLTGESWPTQDSSADEDSSSVTEVLTAPSGSVTARRKPRGRPRVYSMIAAAGLGPESGSQDESSRDVTPLPVADSSVDVGGPPSKKRRLLHPSRLSTRTFSSNFRSDLQNSAPVRANRPSVVIPNKLESDQPSAITNQQQVHSFRRRCQRCKKRRQGCDGAQPCERCCKADISAEDCVSEDEVKFRKSIKKKDDTTANRTSAGPNDGEEVIKPTNRSQLAHHVWRSTSLESFDSQIGGPTITVEAYQPAQLPGSLPTLELPNAKSFMPQLDLRPNDASSVPAIPVAPLRTPRQRSNLKSLTPHHPISDFREKLDPSPYKASKASSRTEPPGCYIGLDIKLLSGKRKRSPETSHDLSCQLVSSASSVAPFEQSRVFSPFHTIQKFFTKRSMPNEDRLLIAGQTTSSSQADSRMLGTPASNGPSSALKSQTLAEVLFARTQSADAKHASYEPSTAAVSSIRNPHPNEALTPDHNDTNIDEEESAASSSSTSGVLPHQTITVQPYSRPSNDHPAQSRPSVPENSSRRPFEDELLNEQRDKNTPNTQMLLALRSSPPIESQIASSKRMAYTNASKRILQQGQMQQQWMEETAEHNRMNNKGDKGD